MNDLKDNDWTSIDNIFVSNQKYFDCKCDFDFDYMEYTPLLSESESEYECKSECKYEYDSEYECELEYESESSECEYECESECKYEYESESSECESEFNFSSLLDDYKDNCKDNYNSSIECIPRLDSPIDTFSCFLVDDLETQIHELKIQNQDLSNMCDEYDKMTDEYSQEVDAYIQEIKNLKQEGMFLKVSTSNGNDITLPNLFEKSILTITSASIGGISESFELKGENTITSNNFIIHVSNYDLILVKVNKNNGTEYLINIKKIINM